MPEANAMSVLRDSEGMPSVGTDFLFRSTEILEDGSEDTAEFGQCIIVEETGSVEYDYDSSVINTCDSSALALEPMSASRIYNAPTPCSLTGRSPGSAIANTKVTGSAPIRPRPVRSFRRSKPSLRMIEGIFPSDRAAGSSDASSWSSIRTGHPPGPS